MHLGKQHISNTLNSASLYQRHMQPFCLSRFKLKTIDLNILQVFLKLVTCLEQIVLCTFSSAAQSL